MKKLSVLALLLCAMLLLTACGGEKKDEPGKELEGTWEGVTLADEFVTFENGKFIFTYRDSDYREEYDYRVDAETNKILIPRGDHDLEISYSISEDELTLRFENMFTNYPVKKFIKCK